MVVNSLNFLLFFTVVFIVYYLPICRNNAKIRNGWLFLVSYFFYGVTDLKMIPLLLGTTLIFYTLGIWLKREMIKKHTRAASYITTLSVCIGIGVLLYFKYLNFFAESVAEILNAIGINVTWTTLYIVLPVGVSFFTFKLISYIIEIHREHIDPCKDFIVFGTYIAFFPTILSGPIDRPKNLIPQLEEVKVFNYDLAVDGCRQILWGMFTKMCIADNLATITDSVWASYSEQTGSTLLIIALLYYIQMYTDFDGYSNMAIGVGKLLGIRITSNFNHPLFARNISEYWSRWHMSLTTWITDYVFMPLNIAFRNWGKWGLYLATLLNLVIIGAWHGANWTFLLFGLFHGVMLVIVTANDKKRKKLEKKYGLKKYSLYKYSRMLLTFILCTIGFLLFRSDSISHFFAVLGRLNSGFGMFFMSWALTAVLPIGIMLFKEYKDENNLNIHFLHSEKLWVQVVSFALLVVFVIYTGALNGGQFIYFQF